VGARRKRPGRRRPEKHERESPAERKALEERLSNELYRPVVDALWDRTHNPLEALAGIARSILAFPPSPEKKERSEMILGLISLAQIALSEGDSAGAIRYAVVATLLLEQVSHRGSVSLLIDHLRRRESRRAGGSLGGFARAASRAKRHADWVRNGQDLQERKPHWSIRRIANELAKTAGAKATTIYQVILPKLRSNR